MPRLKSANNAQSTLTAAITAAQTSFAVASASLFPAVPFRITIDSEVMEVTAINVGTNTFTTVTRGLEGTIGAVHNSGASVENRFTSGTYDELVDTDYLTQQLAGYSQTSHTHIYRLPHTYAIPGEIKVPVGDTDYIIPFFVSLAAGQTVKIAKVRHRINSGTSATVNLQKNGVDVTGLTAISVTTTATDTDPADITLADNDMLQLVVTAVNGTPKNMTFTIFIEYEQ